MGRKRAALWGFLALILAFNTVPKSWLSRPKTITTADAQTCLPVYTNFDLRICTVPDGGPYRCDGADGVFISAVRWIPIVNYTTSWRIIALYYYP